MNSYSFLFEVTSLIDATVMLALVIN